MLERIERALTDLIARFAPWLSPLPTAYLSARATILHLAWPVALGVVAGVIIESLGLAAINTALELYDYNRSRRKTDPAAPLWIAVGLGLVYFRRDRLDCHAGYLPKSALHRRGRQHGDAGWHRHTRQGWS